MNIPVLKCNHRHTIYEHPGCFAKGQVQDLLAKRFEEETGMPWYQHPLYKIGYLDIEVTNLAANFGVVVSWAIKQKGIDKIEQGVITKQELFDYSFDRRIIKSCIDSLSTYAIICTYYGTGHDIPYLRTRALMHNMEFPEYGQLYHFDLYYAVKYLLKLNKNSLFAATDALGIEGKDFCSRETWNKATYGDAVALEEIAKHNRNDVIILEKLHERISPFRKWTRKSI